MPRKKEIPKINTVHTAYNGDSKSFDEFMEALITDYLSSDDMHKDVPHPVVSKVEIIEKSS